MRWENIDFEKKKFKDYMCEFSIQHYYCRGRLYDTRYLLLIQKHPFEIQDENPVAPGVMYLKRRTSSKSSFSVNINAKKSSVKVLLHRKFRIIFKYLPFLNLLIPM